MHTDDQRAIEAFQRGDEFAFVSLYNRHKGAVYAFCLKMLLDRDAAQDVLQETFLRVYENRDRLIQTRSFKAWVFTIARNQCLNQLRRSGRQVALTSVPEIPAERTPAAEMEKSERVELVNRFLAHLKPDYREVIVLREYQNLSYEEIAAITRSSLPAVKSRLHKARRKLADFMEPVLRGEPAPTPQSEGRLSGLVAAVPAQTPPRESGPLGDAT
ncbi:MAG: RNA polymerase sigma factor [Rhodothermales bacterium]